ncbi:MAG: alpha/beta fold hydrolase [Moorea sp. SIOASIH]|uniref:alpha/beta fold hydrolase n=1 Tax=Moorena sp. SIOASIH TaxID=2607817 RepID=UPI0013B7EF5B|nr:alpha/beta fold hydrolase [Moorena sp. SIOASIH]NEO40915.1 alpha/beta fold hydrolase [Moorena sp. SIOASIH]
MNKQQFNVKYVQVSPDLVIHYQEAGSGTPIVFIPGWWTSIDYFPAQLAHFSKRYRAIAYDPRGQGLSSKTLDGNHYIQRGADLNAFLNALELDNVILAGHSNANLDIYSYVRNHGTDRIKAIVAIDCAMPKRIATQEEDNWGEVRNPADMGWLIERYRLVAYNRLDSVPEIIQPGLVEEMTPEVTDFFYRMNMAIPNYVSNALFIDSWFSDYSEEAKLVDDHVPTLWTFSQQRSKFMPQVNKNLPNTETLVLGEHMGHWEFPDEFNTAVEAFLDRRIVLRTDEIEVPIEAEYKSTQYDRVGVIYDQFKGSNEATYAIGEKASFLKALGNIQGKKILDLGCGAGFYTQLLKKKGAAKIVGVDISEEMIRVAREKEEQTQLGVEYLVFDVAEMPKLGSFDLVTAVGLFHHAKDRDHLLKIFLRIYNNLAKNGRLIALTANPDFYPNKSDTSKYGFTPVAEEPMPDGREITMKLNGAKSPFFIKGYIYNRSIYEWIIKKVGFKNYKWDFNLEIPNSALEKYGESYWQDLLINPVMVTLIGEK